LSTKILITGGTGFLGSYIIKELVQKGYLVRALRRSKKTPFWIPKEILEQVEWVEGDVLDIVSLEEAMNGIEIVIHSAAIVSFVNKEKKEMQLVNVDGTANVVNVALEKNVRKLVHISSVAALGRTAGGGHVNEEKKWEESKVNTHYAKSKYRAELEVWRGVAEGLDAVILNPSTIIGYGDWNSSSCAIFKNIYDGFSWYSPGINGFVDVEDVAKITVMLMESDVTEQRFIVNGGTWPFQKLMNTIADAFGKKRPNRKITPLLIQLAWRVEKLKAFFTGKRPLLTKESARVAMSKTYFENDKLLRSFPQFSFTPLDVAIQKACSRYAKSPSETFVHKRDLPKIPQE
jgi:dihydroflavonol-4-reductase